MKIEADMVDEAVARELGRRLTAIRLEQNLSQRQLAERAGLGIRTLQRLEQGEVATQLSGFLRVCRALGLMDRIDQMFAEPPPSPLAQLRRQQKKRRRAAGRRRAARPSDKKWTWGKSS